MRSEHLFRMTVYIQNQVLIALEQYSRSSCVTKVSSMALTVTNILQTK